MLLPQDKGLILTGLHPVMTRTDYQKPFKTVSVLRIAATTALKPVRMKRKILIKQIEHFGRNQ